MGNKLPPSNHLEIGKEQIEVDLRKIGIAEGDHVAVALSFKSIGHVRGGPDAFINALLNVVGPKGTIMMNTHTRSFPISEIDPNFTFDFRSTPPLTGLVPTTLMNRRDSIRSRHPICSIAAIGKLSEYLTKDHDEYSSPYRPFEKLALVGGKYLSIGIDGQLVVVRHESQRRAGLFIVPMLRGVRYKTLKGDIRLFFWTSPPCARNLSKLNPKLKAMGALRQGKIGMATAVVGSVSQLLDFMSSTLGKKPALNLCDDVFCVSCRELERRMILYETIENPKFFQRSLSHDLSGT